MIQNDHLADEDPQNQGDIQSPQEPDETQDETENEDSDKEDTQNDVLSRTSLKQNASEKRLIILYDGLIIIQIPGNQWKISPIT